MKISDQDFHNLKYPSFLEEELGFVEPEDALFHILPVPYEKTVSYGGGTGKGPSKILEASSQLELFTGFSEPYKKGIHTLQPVFAEDSNILLEMMDNSISKILKSSKIPVIIGGEHTVSTGAFNCFAKNKKNIGIVQIDAHADLRESYEGSKHSHACVMKRALDLNFEIFQIGVRSLCKEEFELRKNKKIDYLDAYDLYLNKIPEKILPDNFPDEIYLTIDVDGFDPCVIPATGTPEPGGLMWYDALKIIKKLSIERKIAGFDVVELAPAENIQYPEFTCAKLIYEIMGFI
jgi:agmatinase